MKGFWKLFKKEDWLQKAVSDYLKLKYPNIAKYHNDDSIKTPYGKFRQKVLGLDSGMLDVMIFKTKIINEYTQIYSGLALELKVKPNKLTKNQLEFMNKLIENGWKCNVCYNFDKAKKIIDNYLK